MQTKLVAIAAGAFGYGLLTGWAFTADFLEKRHKQKTTALRQVMRTQIMSRDEIREKLGVDPIAPEVEFVVPMSSSEVYENSKNLIGTEIAPDEDDEENPIPPGETPEETESKLRDIISDYAADRETVDHFVEMAGRTMEFHDFPPYVISAERWAFDPDDGDDYAKIHLEWYPVMRILTDEDGDPIKDINVKVGWDSLNQFGGESGQPNLVYVRNPRELTDYEVELNEGPPPVWIQYGMTRTEFETHRAAGTLRLRPEHQ